MNKHLLKYLAFYVVAILLNSCNDSEHELLEPKVFFEDKEYKLEVEDQESITYDLQARVSSLYSSSVDVSYEIGDESLVEQYNKRNGTEYEIFDVSNASLSSDAATIPEGEIYASKNTLKLSNLSKVEEGKPFLLPIRVKSSSLPTIEGIDIVYFIISKPVRIMKACHFRDSWYSKDYVKVPIPTGRPFTSVTYEALIYIDRFGDNNTIMGNEGILILRIGDSALPDAHRDWIQIAGSKQYHSTESFVTKKWYHVAFTYDQPSGKTAIYINGNKVVESTWDTPSFDLAGTGSGGFFIGRVAGFMWGERPFYGYMSEVRLWSTSRSENEIKQNMLSVDPKSEGLAAYYKLNGEDQFQKDGTWYVKDASGHLDGLARGGSDALEFVDLDKPVNVK